MAGRRLGDGVCPVVLRTCAEMSASRHSGFSIELQVRNTKLETGRPCSQIQIDG